MGAGHADHVELAALDRMARGRHVLDAGRVKGRKPRLGAHFAGEIEMRRRALAHAGDDVAQRLLAVDMAADHVEEVDEPRFRQAARDGEALIPAQAPLPVLVADQPRSKKKVRTDALFAPPRTRPCRT